MVRRGDGEAAAAEERRFRLHEVGTRLKVLSVRPSTHTDKFGGSSSSVVAEVIGVGIIEPQAVLQRECVCRALDRIPRRSYSVPASSPCGRTLLTVSRAPCLACGEAGPSYP